MEERPHKGGVRFCATDGSIDGFVEVFNARGDEVGKVNILAMVP